MKHEYKPSNGYPIRNLCLICGGHISDSCHTVTVEEKEIVIPNRERQQIPKPDPMNKIFGSSTSNGIEEARLDVEIQKTLMKYEELSAKYPEIKSTVDNYLAYKLHAVADKAAKEAVRDVRNYGYEDGFEAALGAVGGEIDKMKIPFEVDMDKYQIYARDNYNQALSDLQSFVTSLKKKQ